MKLDKHLPDSDWESFYCPGCGSVLTYHFDVEVNQSNWDVHDGAVVSKYTCSECEEDFLIDDEGDLVIPESY